MSEKRFNPGRSSRNLSLIIIIGIGLLITALLLGIYIKTQNSDQVIEAVLLNKTVDPEIIDLLNEEPRAYSYLIHHSGVNGGIPGFYSRKPFYQLSENRILAFWDDGHISGFVLLKVIRKEDEVRFKSLKTYCDCCE